MKPIRTLSSNHNFGPPPGHEDEIDDLPCEVVDERGWREIVSVWQPSEEERAAIAAGYNVRLGVGWTGSFPPVSLGVTHQQADATPAPPPGPESRRKPQPDGGRIHG